MSDKTELEEYVGTSYARLVKGTALAIISRAVEKSGMELEFKAVKNISDPSEYGKGLDKSLHRVPSLIQEVIKSEGTDNQAKMEETLKKKIDKTVICLYRPTAMIRKPYDATIDRSQPQVDKADVKALIGYTYAKVDMGDLEELEDDGLIPDYTDIFPTAVKISDTMYPLQDSHKLPVEQDKEDKGYTLCEVLKDFVNVSFSVEIGFITASEEVLHRLQFLLLKNLYENEGNLEQTGYIEYEKLSKSSNAKVTRKYQYTPTELSGLETLSDSNKGKLYGLNVTLENIQTELFSDYTLYNPIDPSDYNPVSINLQIGIKDSQ